MRNLAFMFLLFLFVLGIPSHAAKQGSSMFEFLLVEPDAASTGMASCVSPVIQNANAAYWNPAGLGMMEAKLDTVYSHSFLLSDLQYDNIAGAWNFGKFGAVGLQLSYLYMVSAIEAMDENANPLDLEVPLGFSAVNIAYGKRMFGSKGFGARFYLGASLKMIQEVVHTRRMGAWAMDFGFVGDSILLEDVSFSLVMRNLGVPFQKDRDDIADGSLPFNYTLGISTRRSFYDKYRNEILVLPVFEIHAANDFLAVLRGGVEVSYADFKRGYRVFFRGGCQFSEDLVGYSGIHMGLGGQLLNLKIDYSLIPFHPAGMMQRIGFEAAFE
jgi:hypothetical protein